ncbi:uncharacterized protein si:dkey-122a22.2 isoform X2 [Brienomyrus brachyistius]|uniref:uncharacterized protein si:dkey-122a22.2 isoform X2 n=1 Tax=Brienomyrus brachyistius TaxID=42636 RepID=UPI0020B3128E|nr:uncharacterized protein si:dkey-122a22.2 isoform X2 [Brienomyrus brachyistius]
MLRNRTITQDKSNTNVKDDNNKAEESNVSAGPAKNKGFCAKVTDVGKVVLLIIFIPPFLNYASLQREGALLVPEGAQSVDIGLGQKVHLLCKGQGEPVVLLDAPTGMSSESWFYIQEEVSQKTRVCTYDRVGLGFSKRALQNQTTGTEKVWGVSTTGRYSQLVPYLQVMQLAAATGLTRIFIIVGWIHPAIEGEMVPENVIQKQKYLLSNPSHQSSTVDEHFFLNESASQVREISVYKPLTSRTSVSMVTGDHFDNRLPAHLNQIVAEHQKRFQEQFYPSAKRIHVHGADRRAIYEDHSIISRHLQEIVEQRQLKQQSQ